MWTLITGGAKRLGAEICLALAEKGLPVLVHYQYSQQEAKQVAAACRACGVDAEIVQGDFSFPSSTMQFITHCLEQFPDIKHLINNVGPYLVKPGSKTSLEEWLSIFQTNLHAPFALSRAFLSNICQNHGSIINIGVVGLNSFRADIHRTAYMASKAALLQLTKSLAREMAASHVRVNMVSPGYLENAIDLPEDMNRLPMGRPATLKEVVDMVAFLLQDSSSYITGQNIEVSGGVNL